MAPTTPSAANLFCCTTMAATPTGFVQHGHANFEWHLGSIEARVFVGFLCDFILAPK